MRRGAIAAIATLVVLGHVGSAAALGPWDELRRPIDLPSVGSGQACPVSQVDQSVDWDSTGIFGGSGIGRGPVYAGLGETKPPGDLFVDAQGDKPNWLGGKLFWYVDPSYEGLALIRGRRLDGRGRLRFATARQSERGLRVKRHSDTTWQGQPDGSRGVPSGVLVRSGGCYGVQVDGASFSNTIVFTVTP